MTNILRTIAERASRNISFRAHLPARFGRRPIYVSPGNQLAIWKPGNAKFQDFLLGFVDRFVTSDMVVWDVGANMGMFLLPAAHRARQVIEFEPDAFNQLLLNRTRAANPDLAIDVVPCAVADQPGIAQFDIAVRGRSSNALTEVNKGSQTGGVRQSTTVVTLSLDWALDHFPAPDFVKIDAENAEGVILRGAARLLRDVRPVMAVEICLPSSAECEALFAANDYALFAAYEPIDPAKAITCDLYVACDVIAVPRERVHMLAGR